MPRPATLQDVAKRAGVHRTTVSMALRSHPSIPAVTRDRIREIAERLNYRANPLVTALMQSRRAGSTEKHAVLAYVTNHPTRSGWKPPQSNQPDYFGGAAERAKELGYKLEHFWMSEPGMSPERFANILRARGIYGLLIARLPAGRHVVEMDWQGFCSVAFGLTLESPVLHHVGENHFDSTHRATRECIDRGYKRVGFVYSTRNEFPRVDDRWLGGYSSQQKRLLPKNRLPAYEGNPTDQGEFIRWFERWRPDAIVASKAPPVIAMLESIGLRVPGDIGLVELLNENPLLGHAGLYYDPSKIGALGVEMLVGLLHRSESGVPTDPHEVLLTGEWREGRTLRPRA